MYILPWSRPQLYLESGWLCPKYPCHCCPSLVSHYWIIQISQLGKTVDDFSHPAACLASPSTINASFWSRSFPFSSSLISQVHSFFSNSVLSASAEQPRAMTTFGRASVGSLDNNSREVSLYLVLEFHLKMYSLWEQHCVSTMHIYFLLIFLNDCMFKCLVLWLCALCGYGLCFITLSLTSLYGV